MRQRNAYRHQPPAGQPDFPHFNRGASQRADMPAVSLTTNSGEVKPAKKRKLAKPVRTSYVGQRSTGGGRY